MSDLKRSNPELQEMFSSAVSLRKGAEFLLTFGNQYADCAAALCNESAMRMMSAYSDIHDLQPDMDDIMDTDLWNACMAHRDELFNIDEQAQILLDCGSPEFPRSAEKAQHGVDSVIILEKTMLEISPELASEQ